MGRLHARMRRVRWKLGHSVGFLSVLLGIVVAFALISYFNARYEPVLESIATTQIQNAVSRSINSSVAEALSDGNMTYDDLVTLEKNESGQITALQSNMSAINSIRASLLQAALDSVDGLISQEMGIPIGSLSSIALLSGRGPEIPFKLVSVGTASASIDNVFTDAGINQTHHQIMLTITTQLSILLPGHVITTTNETSICIAETVIVGTVPDMFVQVDTTG